MIAGIFGQFRNRVIVFLHDLAWVPVSIFLAFELRFNLGRIPAEFVAGFLWMTVVAVPIFGFLYWLFGLYRGTWRFVSLADLIRLLKTVALGVLATSLAIFVLRRFEGVPRSVVVLFPILLAFGLSGSRLIYRWVRGSRIRITRQERERTLIVGAGTAGELLMRNLLGNGVYLPAALVDVDPAMVGKEIHGVRVFGVLDDIPAIIRRMEIAIVILAVPQIQPNDLRKVLAFCADLEIPCRTIPRRDPSGRIIVDESKLRPVRIEDLLSREPVALNMEGISQHLLGKRVLVTGGGGSIGSELCRQVAAQQPERLIILDSSEYNLYQIERNIQHQSANLAFDQVLCDVKDAAGLDWVFAKYQPQLVFHAAAYKHVPLLEANCVQAVRNNVYGTKAVAGAADRHGCEQFVLISTDKAVNPTNVMGATKRVAEIYCQNFNARSSTRIITTRFGNVLGSAGSVVPLFESQIAKGGPVTVTHPEIKRYFMTIPEAVGLILQASSMGKGGEIFVLEMGDPVKIRDLAEHMIRLAGLKPYQDIPIIMTGLRSGEKLFEELFHESEKIIGTTNPKVLLAEFRQVDWDWLSAEMAALEAMTWDDNGKEILRQLQKIVPEFNPGVDLQAGATQGQGKHRMHLVK